MSSNISVRIRPSDDPFSGWTETLPAPDPARRLKSNEKADAVVVGGGLTGLAMARRLHELRPDWRVVLVEAQRVGAGASGRASGFVVDLTDAAARMEPRMRDNYVALARYGIDHLRALVHEHTLDCDWDETGWIRACAGDAGQNYLDALPERYDLLGIAYEQLDRDAMASITGSNFYRCGMRLPGYPLVQTGALVREMWRVLPPRIEVFEESPVTRIEGSGSYRISAGDGTLTAAKVFLATNGYTPSLGFLQQRVFPLYTFGSLTRVLTREEQQTLGGEREWGLLAMDPMGSTVRRTRDQRLLIRNWIYYNKQLRVGEDVRKNVLKHHHQAFQARFPKLKNIDFEYTWSGLMGSAHNSMITSAELKPNLYVVAGFTAAGIAMSQAGGRLLVDHALGEESSSVRDLLTLPKATWMPPEPFRSLGGNWMAERMNKQAGDYL